VTNDHFIDLSVEAQTRLIDGARDSQPVIGLTHGFYKYPARFSPAFARAAIEAFTKPGDVVMDPHVGGGTSLVEAIAAGRHAIGVDISELAEFVTTVKTTVYGAAELDKLDAWSRCVASSIGLRKRTARFEGYLERGYYKHLDNRSRWRLRKAIEQGLLSALRLDSERLKAFGRCAVLRTAQWALDGRARLPNLDGFRRTLEATAVEMVEGARALHDAVNAIGRSPMVAVLHRTAHGIENDEHVHDWHAPRLVVTSPPYPGVHVLYHRWQVDGRKETPAPFWIAGKLDGSGSSYYTMGDRKYPQLATYFANIKGTMSSVAKVANKDTIFVQMVAFSDASWQLPRYLEAMNEAGLQEVFLPALGGERLWRSVPGRRWYSDQRGATPGSQEVVLIHRKAPARQPSKASLAASVAASSTAAR